MEESSLRAHDHSGFERRWGSGLVREQKMQHRLHAALLNPQAPVQHRTCIRECVLSQADHIRSGELGAGDQEFNREVTVHVRRVQVQKIDERQGFLEEVLGAGVTADGGHMEGGGVRSHALACPVFQGLYFSMRRSWRVRLRGCLGGLGLCARCFMTRRPPAAGRG